MNYKAAPRSRTTSVQPGRRTRSVLPPSPAAAAEAASSSGSSSSGSSSSNSSSGSSSSSNSSNSSSSSSHDADQLSTIGDDLIGSILEQLPTKHMPAMRLVSQRYARLVVAAWPNICRHRFPGAINLPRRILWSLTARRYAEDEAVKSILALLDRIHESWPDALSRDDAGVERRWFALRTRWASTWLRLPADAAVFYLLGASLLGASPIGTLSGDFGPDFDDETEREIWRVGLSWPPLTEEADLTNPPSESYQLQTFQEYGEFYDSQGVYYGRPLFAGAATLFLAAGFTEFTVHGTEQSPKTHETHDGPPYESP